MTLTLTCSWRFDVLVRLLLARRHDDRPDQRPHAGLGDVAGAEAVTLLTRSASIRELTAIRPRLMVLLVMDQ